MAMPAQFTLPFKVTNIVSRGPDSNGKYTFTYTLVRQGAPANEPTILTVEHTRPDAEDYPLAQGLDIRFTTT